MKTYLGLTQNPICSEHSVLTLGLFDGVHQGHQFLLKRAKELAVKKKATFVVFTFRTLPRVDQKLVTAYFHKKSLLEKLGVDILIELSFSSELQTLSPLAFISAVERMFPVSTWVVGEDIRFGADRSGDRTFLAEYAPGDVVIVEPFFRQEFSSTQIRKSIQRGHMSRASFLLGRSYSIIAKAHMQGHSDSSLQTGTQVSTLKLDAQNLCLPLEGTWRSLVQLDGDGHDIPSVFSVSRQGECLVELFGECILPKTFFVEVTPLSQLMT